MNDKAQVTIFVIAGLLLLLGVIISVTVFADYLSYRPDEAQVISELETELQPLVFSINECQEVLLEEASHQALRQGGYINPALGGLRTSINPTNNAVYLNEQTTIPYWRYARSGTETTTQPPLQGPSADSIASQLASYVDERLTDCVDWREFPQWDIDALSPRSRVTFSDDETRINTAWRVVAQTNLGVKEYDGFQAEIDAPVQRLYRLAETVTDASAGSQLPENRLLDWLSLYSGLNDLPDLAGSIDISRRFDVYPVADAREELDLVIARTLQHVQILNTRNHQMRFWESDTLNQIMLNSIIPPIEPYSTPRTSFRAYNPQTNHPSTETYLTLNGNRAIGIPEITRFPLGVLAGIMPPMVDNSYDYEIIFPVIYEFSHNGYTLQVAYQASIQDNQPTVLRERLDQQEFNLCDDLGGSNIDITTEPPNTPATAIYTCGDITCPVGELPEGRLSAQLPACASGELNLYGDNRFSEAITVSSSLGVDHQVTVDLYEPQDVQVRLESRILDKVFDDYVLQTNTFVIDAEVFLIRQDAPYVQVLETGQGTAELLPGKYEVFAIRLYEGNAIIPAETRVEGRVWGGVISSGEEVELPEIELDGMPEFFLELEDVEITAQTTQLTLTGVEILVDHFDEIEDLELLGEMMEQAAALETDGWSTDS